MKDSCSECGKKLVKIMAITDSVSDDCFCSYSCLTSKFDEKRDARER